jgi:sigma-B regulation protein RsbU (phosphoserine phosphatase)
MISTAKDRRPLVALALLLLVSGSYQLAHSLGNLGVLAHPEAQVAAPLVPRSFTHVVGRVRPEATSAGLRAGDRVLRVDGNAFHGFGDLARPLAAARPGDTLTVEVSRPDEPAPRTIPIALTPRFDRPLSASEWGLGLGLGVLTPWLCLALGYAVAFLRPRDLRAWLLLLLMLSFSQISDVQYIDVNGWSPLAATLGQGYSRLMGELWPIGMLLFGVYFPDQLALDRRRPWLKWVLILPLVAQGTQMALRDALAVLNLEAAQRTGSLLPPGVRFSLMMLAIGLFFAAMWRRWGGATAPDTRRRLSLLLWGTNLSITPMGVLVTTAQISGRDPFSFSPWFVMPVLLVLVGFPITLAYVIVVERAMDVRVVVRQGLQYALARNGILAIQIVLSAVIIFAAASLATNPGVNRPRIIMTVAVGVMLVFLTRNAAAALRGWTDRRFFREAYDAERILSELGETVRTMVEMQPLLQTVTERISASLHVPRVAVLLREGDAYAPAHATGAPEALPRFAADGPLAVRMRTLEPLRVYGDDPQARVNRDPALASERPGLDALGAELLLPLAVKDELVGILALGPKQSEAPYSSSDLRLLQSVANQTALALENSRLTAAIASEVALRARMSREVEIAREVQERLFPQNHPEVRGMDYAGACRPALGVGGDYFDFLELTGGRLGLAIGDVSGKGISAALLMASLQASLRGQSLAGGLDLAVLMGNVNQLIYEASQANRYATFFYGTYDPGDGLLRYVNAGHNAPMLLRGANGSFQVERLDQGGPVIGLLYPVPYLEASVALQPGDLLVAYTDGISEAMNRDDEEWGEERLQAAATACRDLPAAEMVTRVFSAADGFVAGAKQHDDMTLVVARILPST